MPVPHKKKATAMRIHHAPGRAATVVPITDRKRAREGVERLREDAKKGKLYRMVPTPEPNEHLHLYEQLDSYEHPNTQRTTSSWFPEPKYAIKKQRREKSWETTLKFAVEFAMGRDPGCTCKVRTNKPITVICLLGPKELVVDSCHCGRYAAMMITKHGVFPATPVAPFRAYDILLLRLMRNQTMAGPVSKQAWANGLHKTHEEEALLLLPNYYKTVGLKHRSE